MFRPSVSAMLAMPSRPALGCVPWCIAPWMLAHFAGKRRDGLPLVPTLSGRRGTRPGSKPEIFATPSPRLIPEGEKPESFTGLALAPYEGRTLKGRDADG